MQFVRGLQSIHYTGLSRCTLLAERQPLASLWLAAAISTQRSAQQRLCSAAAAASYDVITARASVLGSTQTDIPRCNLSKLIFITALEQKRWKMFMNCAWMTNSREDNQITSQLLSVSRLALRRFTSASSAINFGILRFYRPEIKLRNSTLRRNYRRITTS